MTAEEFGKYLKELRTERELTTRQLELQSGVSNSYISQLENGKRGMPTPNILKKLAPALKVSYEKLMLKAGYLPLDKKIEMLTPEQYEGLIEALVKTSYPYAVSSHFPSATTEETHRNFYNTILKKTPGTKLSPEQYTLIKSHIDGIDIINEEEIAVHSKLQLPAATIKSDPPIPSNAILIPEHQHVIKLPIFGEVRAGVGGYALQEYLGEEEWIVSNGDCKNCYMLKVKGDSMTPRFLPCDYAIVRPQNDVDSGEVAIVIVDGDEGIIKRIKKVPDGLILKSDNSLYDDREFYKEETSRVKIVGKVIGIKPGRI
ncbi:MAG: helix-turn-helix protein [Firmicutes bacterium]|nr:helix-turn-helix protein [Bacillota bacterium]